MTNAVYFIKFPSELSIPTLLLRIYGPSSGFLIARTQELRTLHVLSTQYGIGPHIYGTFRNGRVEEYFESTPLTPTDLRDTEISQWIGARMAELHSVDLSLVYGSIQPNRDTWEIGVHRNVISWLPPARDILSLSTVNPSDRSALDLNIFQERWLQYIEWLSQKEKVEGLCGRVFAHNDAQYGNLLRLTDGCSTSAPDHHQV